jgi:hypothetical protein
MRALLESGVKNCLNRILRQDVRRRSGTFFASKYGGGNFMTHILSMGIAREAPYVTKSARTLMDRIRLRGPRHGGLFANLVHGQGIRERGEAS